MIDSSAFTKIAVVTDRDQRRISSICDSIKSSFNPVITDVENNAWRKNSYKNSYGQIVDVDFFMLVIPSEKEGALETLLLDAISEDPYDEVIVDRSKEYVDHITPQAARYIQNDRLKLKAYLGVAWAIQYPSKVFTLIDEQMRTVQWEKSSILEDCFRILKLI